MTLAGVPNLHKVADGLYRSAQPTAEGMTNIIDEMKNGGFGYHSVWGNLPRFIRKSAQHVAGTVPTCFAPRPRS